MKTIKRIDAFGSILLILFFVWAVLTDLQTPLLPMPLFYGYIVVGGWQLLSMIVHAACRWNPAGTRTRNIYFLISLIFLITMPIGSVYILFFISPFMAIFYTGFCFYEIDCLKTRPITLLK